MREHQQQHGDAQVLVDLVHAVQPDEPGLHRARARRQHQPRDMQITARDAMRLPVQVHPLRARPPGQLDQAGDRPSLAVQRRGPPGASQSGRLAPFAWSRVLFAIAGTTWPRERTERNGYGRLGSPRPSPAQRPLCTTGGTTPAESATLCVSLVCEASAKTCFYRKFMLDWRSEGSTGWHRLAVRASSPQTRPRLNRVRAPARERRAFERARGSGPGERDAEA